MSIFDKNSWPKRGLNPQERAVIYTLVPPPLNSSADEIQRRIQPIKELRKNLLLDAINIPEVRDEKRNPRTRPFEPKLAPRDFAQIAKRELRDEALQFIIDRGVAHAHWAHQKRWLENSIKNFGVRTLVLVGRDSSKGRYAGPSVERVALEIQREFSNEDLLIGGITIPARQNEPERLLQKSQNGIEFFISQVLFEAEPVTRLLAQYKRICDDAEMRPKRIFLSFAPVTSASDLKFFRWWDVNVPESIELKLLRDPASIFENSLAYAEEILLKILSFSEQMKIGVPLGINIEHVSAKNLNASIELAKSLISRFDPK